jgi:DNA-directed RNA polymerase subunit RPC12/RpoP
MGEFKFACPVCGQHITAERGSAGTQIECPTCFRKIVVPQPPANSDSKLILSAAEADKPARPLPGGPGGESAAGAGRPRSVPVAAVVLVVAGVVGAGLFFFRDHLPTKRGGGAVSPTNSAPAGVPVALVTNSPAVLDLAQAIIPETKVSGTLRGTNFTCQRVTLQNGLLSIRQGKTWPPELAVAIQLHARQSEDLAGKSVEVAPDRLPPVPRVTLRWRDEEQKSVSQMFTNGYALRLKFGAVEDKFITGRIYLALPDDYRSSIAGTFKAEILPPSQKTKKPKTPAPPSR